MWKGLSQPAKQKIGSAAEIIRKGGTLLRESCPKCGGLQVRYKGRTICLNCGDISNIAAAEDHSPSDILAGLRDLVLGKISEASNLLKVESDVEKQSNLVSLLLKYVELLDKTGKSTEGKTEAK